MEDNIQTIIVVIISAFLLFIFPVYMAYEKKDDISYALAMRYTQDLVDEVRSKGYISKYMYEDYRAKLKVTGNSYDIQMTHEYNRYDPITNYYKIEDKKYILVKATTREERKIFEESVIEEAINIGKLQKNSPDKDVEDYLTNIYESQGINKVEDSYELSKQVYTTDHIVNILNSERKLLLNANAETVTCGDDDTANDSCQYAYVMNVDDNFNITIKNTNITLATVIYNMVTANTLDNNTRIYVNYGGAILSSKWYGDIDYAKMDHDKLTLAEYTTTNIFTDERHFHMTDEGGIYPTKDVDAGSKGTKYILEFDVKPEEVTELRQKGNLNVDSYTGYNFAFGNKGNFEEDSMLSVSVGLNGISLITENRYKLQASASFNITGTKTVAVTKATTTTCQVKNEYVIQAEDGSEQITQRYDVQACSDIQKATQITDYSKVNLKYVSENKFQIALTGKDGIKDVIVEVSTDTGDLFKDLNYISNNPTGTIRTANNAAGYSIQVANDILRVTTSREENTTIRDYDELELKKLTSDKMQVILRGNGNIEDIIQPITINGDYQLFDGLVASIPYPTARKYPGTTRYGQDYNIIVSENEISISATKKEVDITTILSSPVPIDNYANVRIEVEKNESEKYVATLYVDGEKVDESIEMDYLPKVGMAGKTYIDDKTEYFEGYLKNVTLYSYGGD